MEVFFQTDYYPPAVLGMEELRKMVIPKVSTKWIQIAPFMNFEPSDIQNIKEKCGDNPTNCCTELFRRWLQIQPRAGRKWENLLPILKEVLDSETIDHIVSHHVGLRLVSQTSASLGESSLSKAIQEGLQKENATSMLRSQTSASRGESSLSKAIQEGLQKENEPKMKWMHKVIIPQVSYYWRTLADYMEYPIAKKKEIEERQRGDPYKCCAELMEDWLTSDRGVSPKTWHILVSVLKEIKELSSSVKSIEGALLKEGLLSVDDENIQSIKDAIIDAKEKGLVIKIRHSKVLFCGSSRIGKTNFINLLLKNRFEKSHKPTGVTESHQLFANHCQVMFTELASQTKDKGCQLQYMDYKTQIKWLRGFLSAHPCQNTIPGDSENDNDDNDDFDSSINDQSQQISPVEYQIASEVDAPLNNLPEVWNILTFLDTGGQPAFINLLPALNSSAMITFILHSMEDGVDGLTKNVTVYGDGPKEYSLDYKYIDLVKMLFSMRKPKELHMFEQFLAEKDNEGDKTCYLSLVGTKSDLCNDSNAVAKSIGNKLKPIIDQTIHKSSLIPIGGKYFVPVSSCKAGTDEEDPIATEFRSCIFECLEKRDVLNIPIVWLILELEITNKTKEDDVISFNKVFKICKEYNLITNEADVRTALQFFHHVGIFLYYGSDGSDMKSIADIVITNYQWVFKNLTAMVKAAKRNDDVTEDFRCSGRLDKHVLNKCIDWKLGKDVSVKYFLKLLEKLAIVSPTKRTHDPDEYFMPCVLQTFSLDTSSEQDFLTKFGTKSKADPLLMQLVFGESDVKSHFHDDQSHLVPRGVFCCLINQLLLNHPRFKVQWSIDDNVCVFNNLIVLHDDISKCSVVLIDKIMYLKVEIRQNTTVCESYHGIKGAIASTLKTVCDQLRLDISHICIGFLCSEDDKLYWTAENYDQISENVTIYNRNNNPKQLEESQKIWFLDQCSTANTGTLSTTLSTDADTNTSVAAGVSAFIVYAKEENDPGGDQVLCLSNLLFECGISCDIDLYHTNDNILDWPSWVENKLKHHIAPQHSFIIMVCSPTMFSTLEERNDNASIEMAAASIDRLTLRRYLQQGVQNILPLCINDSSTDYIPPNLSGKTCYYFPYNKLMSDIPEGTTAHKVLDHPDFTSLRCLVATLTGQQENPIPNVGPVPLVQSTVGAPFTSANTSSSASMHQGTNPTVTSSTKAERSLQDIETEFKEMINKLQKAFIDGNVDLDDLLMTLKNSFATKNRKVPLFEKNLFRDVTSIGALFKVLDYHWNLYDHDMLAFLINIANCEKANKIYTEFSASTNLSGFGLINHCPDKEIFIAPGYKILQIKIEKSECTITVVKKIKMMIVEYFELEKYAIVHKRVTKGCINIEVHISDRVASHIQTKTLSIDFKGQLTNEAVVSLHCGDYVVDIGYRKKGVSSVPDSTSSDFQVPKNELLYTLNDLTHLVKSKINKIENNVMDRDQDKHMINGVQLLLMVVNPSEYYAAMFYFSKKEAKILNNDGTIYYIGKWGEIPAALVKQQDSGFNGIGRSNQLTRLSVNLFCNLELIVAIGVCGITVPSEGLANVVVSTKICGCNDLKVTDEIINRSEITEPGDRILKYLKHNNEFWSFTCTKPEYNQYKSEAKFKPMLSGTPLIASGEFRDKLIRGVNKEAVGVEMEGIGVLQALREVKKRDSIEFIIVKAGCDYADESKNKEWQPVAAMAAADFLYEQLTKKIVYQDFIEEKSLEDIEADFKEMIHNLQKSLVDSSVKLDDLLMNLKSCFATKNKEVPLFEKNFFKHATSIEALFKVLNLFWNIYDHDMLALLVDTAKCEEASKIYHEFVDSVDLSAFNLTNYCSDEEVLTLPGYKTFQITVENSDCTGKLVKRIKYMIVDYYKLEKYAITLKEVIKGSIIIIFLASDSISLYIKNGTLTSEFMEKLRQEGFVLFNGVNIKEDTTERDASCAVKLTANGKDKTSRRPHDDSS